MTALPHRRRALALAAVAGVLLSPRSGHAFCRTTTTPVSATYKPELGCFTVGLPLFWRSACVGYNLNQAASASVPFPVATTAIDAAFASWNAVSCGPGGAVGIRAESLGAVTCSEVRYNLDGPNQNVIVFRDNGWPYQDPNSTIALTTVSFNPETGEIYDVDMEINASGANLTTSPVVPAKGFDLRFVVTHEVGHFFGLAHAANATSTMFAEYRAGEKPRALTPDDTAGICAIYPDVTRRNVAETVAAGGVVAAAACDRSPRHGFAPTCEEYPPPSEAGSACATAVRPSPGGRGSADWTSPVSLAVGLVALLAARRRSYLFDRTLRTTAAKTRRARIVTVINTATATLFVFGVARFGRGASLGMGIGAAACGGGAIAAACGGGPTCGGGPACGGGA